MLKNLLNKFTEEQGEPVPQLSILAMSAAHIAISSRSVFRLIPHIHMHPLFFETGLKCHSCDVCGDQMKASWQYWLM